MVPSFAQTASVRAQLQRLVGDVGEILPRVGRGDLTHPSAGWYLRPAEGGPLIYLGDHSGVAAAGAARYVDRRAK